MCALNSQKLVFLQAVTRLKFCTPSFLCISGLKEARHDLFLHQLLIIYVALAGAFRDSLFDTQKKK